MNRAYISIGSNIDKKINYPKALRRLRAVGNVLAMSSVYETVPIGNPNAETFFNGVILLETELDARTLKRALRTIETQLGRARTLDPYAPRTIDLDLVLFNHAIIDDGEVHVPDRLILRRPFLARALAEISPQYVHPIDKRTLAEIADDVGKHPAGVRLAPAATVNARQIFNRTYRGELVHVHTRTRLN